MILSRSNFFEKLPSILDSLSKSHFIAFDFEMSGLCSDEKYRNLGSDSQQQRYWKLKESIKSFLPLQIGLYGMRIKNINEIETYPYGFYLFPNVLNENSDFNFKMEHSAIKFLMKHQFDFNKFIYDGIYFTSQEKEEQIKNFQILKGIKTQIKEKNFIVSVEMIAFCELYKEKVN